MTKLKVLCTIVLLALAPVGSGQVEYESVRVAVAPGVTCPAAWTASTESITIPDSLHRSRSGVHRRQDLPCYVGLR